MKRTEERKTTFIKWLLWFIQTKTIRILWFWFPKVSKMWEKQLGKHIKTREKNKSSFSNGSMLWNKRKIWQRAKEK